MRQGQADAQVIAIGHAAVKDHFSAVIGAVEGAGGHEIVHQNDLKVGLIKPERLSSLVPRRAL